MYSSDPTKYTSLDVAGVPTMGMNGIPMTSGNVWFVSSVIGSSVNAGSFDAPFATITQAQTAASTGDVVVLMSGHAETITAAAGIDLSKAGVIYVGLGTGNLLPTFTFTTSTAATLTMTGANVSLTNIRGTTTIDQIVSPFVVSGTHCVLDLHWHDQDATHEALRAVLTTAGANDLVLSLEYHGYTAGTHGVNGVRIVGGRNIDVYIDYYGIVTTAVVEFVTTATVDCQINGQFYVSGTTDLSKNVVDTVTGSTWTVQAFDGAAGASFSGGSGAAIAPDDGSTGAVVATADGTANAYSRDVTGNKTDAAVYAPVTTKSNAAYAKGTADLQEKVALKAAATIVNAQTLFTVAGGPIVILALVSICVTADDATASTLQYSATPTSGSAQTISGASGSLANAAAGASVTLAGTALATAALLNANGPNLIANPGTIMVPAGTITAVVGVGSTTGTWRHYIRYRPLATGVTVS